MKVLGETRFFGRVLVKSLIERGHDVTIATRGLTDDEFKDKTIFAIFQLQLKVHDRIRNNQFKGIRKTVTNDLLAKEPFCKVLNYLENML